MAVEDLPQIVRAKYDVPRSTWGSWILGQEEVAARDLAAELTSNPAAAEVVRRWVRTARSKTVGDGSLGGFMIWVPDPSTGAVACIGSIWTLSWKGERRPTRDEYLAQAQAYDGDATTRVLEKTVGPLDEGMAGGPGVLEVLMVADVRRSLFGGAKQGRVDELIRGTVFPEGTSDVVRFIWMPTPPGLRDPDLDSGITTAVKSVTVTLGRL